MKAEKEKINRLLKTAKGQIDGLLRMVEQDRYCIDISNQLLATMAILRNINKDILNAHMNNCIKEAFEQGDAEQKIEEIVKIMDKLSR